MTHDPSTEKVSLARYVVLTADSRRLRREIAADERADFHDALADGTHADGLFGEWSLTDAARIALNASRLTGRHWYVQRMSARSCRYERSDRTLRDIAETEEWPYGRTAYDDWDAAGRPNVQHGSIATFDDWGYRESQVEWHVIEFGSEPCLYDDAGDGLMLSDCTEPYEVAVARAVRLLSSPSDPTTTGPGPGDPPCLCRIGGVNCGTACACACLDGTCTACARLCALCLDTRRIARPADATIVVAAWWHEALGGSECKRVPVCEDCFGATHAIRPSASCPSCGQRTASQDDARVSGLLSVDRVPGG